MYHTICHEIEKLVVSESLTFQFQNFHGVTVMYALIRRKSYLQILISTMRSCVTTLYRVIIIASKYIAYLRLLH